MFRQLALAMSCDERKCPTAPSESAERKTNLLKGKALRNTYRAFLRACGYSVPIGFVPVVVCSTILIMTCVERKAGAPVGYELMTCFSIHI